MCRRNKKGRAWSLTMFAALRSEVAPTEVSRISVSGRAHNKLVCLLLPALTQKRRNKIIHSFSILGSDRAYFV